MYPKTTFVYRICIEQVLILPRGWAGSWPPPRWTSGSWPRQASTSRNAPRSFTNIATIAASCRFYRAILFLITFTSTHSSIAFIVGQIARLWIWHVTRNVISNTTEQAAKHNNLIKNTTAPVHVPPTNDRRKIRMAVPQLH